MYSKKLAIIILQITTHENTSRFAEYFDLHIAHPHNNYFCLRVPYVHHIFTKRTINKLFIFNNDILRNFVPSKVDTRKTGF